MEIPNDPNSVDTGSDTKTQAVIDKQTIKFLEEKKKDMKKSQYRTKFDALYHEIKDNLVSTAVSYGQKLYESNGWGSMVFYNKMANGAYDYNVYPQKITDRDQNRSGVPVSQEPIAFSKIMIATSVLAGKLPDAEVIGDDKVAVKAYYELWKRTWYLKGGNGENTLTLTFQNLLTYGWAAFRTYPRRVSVKRQGVDKILFDDIYREPLDPARTWLGLGFTNGDYWSQFEVYYEKDMLKSEFFAKYPDAVKNARSLDYCSTTTESKDQNQEKARHSVTIGYYENVLMNRFIVACGKMVIYDGEMPNDESYGSVTVVRCFARDLNDPHGVGLYELMRGNTALFTYINSLNAQQVEAEIYPLLFGAQVQNGTASYKRGPNIVNPKNPGTQIDVVRTTGNVSQGIAFADKQKQDIEENTGVNNIVAGQNAESTLGSTVILKEAAYNRLTPPKNSMMNGLQSDAHIALSWIKQTYSVDKVFMMDNDGDVTQFVKQNPDYFIQSAAITDSNGKPKGYAVTASKNLRLNFDFTPDGEMLENVPTRSVSAKMLFDEMNAHGHTSDYVEFVIDPDSMLLPSLEIQKQTFMALFPVITNQINTIYSLRRSDPEAAASQLRSLEQLLDIQRQDIYDYIPKQQYDDIIALKPSENLPQPPPDPSSIPKVNVSIKADAATPSGQELLSEVGIAPALQSQPVPQQDTGQPGISDNPNPGAPLPVNNVPRPQSPMGSAVDASVGRAGNLPFFPGK